MKDMKLYHAVHRIYRQLEGAGISANDPLRVDDLTQFDQYHYHGTAAVDEAARAMGLRPGMSVLDVGAGIGGPARYLAESAKVHVTALELQPDLNEVGADLTRRCGLEHQVTHLCGNVLDGVSGEFDAVLSMLCFMHIPDRAALFANCRAALKKGGTLYIEDYARTREATSAEADALARKVQCPFLPTVDEYRRELTKAGFSRIDIADMTEDWAAFTARRLSIYRSARDRHISLHGAEVVAGLDDFYETVAGLLANGPVAGLRIVAS